MERGNRTLGDTLRALLLNRSTEEWDLLLPHIMRGFRSIPDSPTFETANFMMFGRELRLPDQMKHHPIDDKQQTVGEYALELQERMRDAHEALVETQKQLRQEDDEEPLLFHKPKFPVKLQHHLSYYSIYFVTLKRY